MNKKKVVYDLIAYKLSLKTDPKNRKPTMHNIPYYFDCHFKMWWEISVHIIFLNIG